MKRIEHSSVKAFFSTLAVIHAGLVVGLLLFLSIAFYINATGKVADDVMRNIFIWVVPFIAASGVLVSSWIYKKRIREVRDVEDFRSRLSTYQTAIMIRWYILEGVALLSIVTYLITGDAFFFAIAGLLIVVLVMVRASRRQLVGDLQLNSIEKMLIANPDAMIS